MQSFWDLMADQFHHQSQPLRPGPEDTRIMEKAVLHYFQEQKPAEAQVLMLGVTPEIATLAWPPEAQVMAIERSSAMIQKIWPGDIPGKRQAVCLDWFDLKIGDHSRDLIVGDGFFTAMGYPARFNELVRTFCQWLKPEGQFVVRLFLNEGKKETVADIRKDLEAGKYCAFDALKFRLAKALQKSVEEGVVVNDVYLAWMELAEQMPDLPEKAGWPRLRVNTIQLYKGRETHYHFPTTAEMMKIVDPLFEVVSVTKPTYEFGESYPTWALRPKK